MSEKANDLLNKFGSAQFDFVVWNTPDNLVARDKARQEISDYIAELEAEVTKCHELQDAYCDRIAELESELKITDELLKEATEAIGAVVACCTYNSNDEAKIGIYGIDQKAFTRIDQFITHYNDAVSAGKVSVDVKTSTDNNKGGRK